MGRLIERWAEDEGFESPALLIQEIMTRLAYQRYPMQGTELDSTAEGEAGAEILRNS